MEDVLPEGPKRKSSILDMSDLGEPAIDPNNDEHNLKMLVCKVKVPSVTTNGMYTSVIRTPRGNRAQRGQSEFSTGVLLVFWVLVYVWYRYQPL